MPSNDIEYRSEDNPGFAATVIVPRGDADMDFGSGTSTSQPEDVQGPWYAVIVERRPGVYRDLYVFPI